MAQRPFRRIVTGHDAHGRAIISSSGAPPTVISVKASPGTVFYEVWNTTGSPVPIDNGPDPTLKPLQLHPTPHGSLIRVVDIPPDHVRNNPNVDAAAAFAEIGAAHASTAHANAPHRFMHRTQTIDYGVLLSGEIWLVVDDGEMKLKPGDIVIQRGTNHAWSNRTNEIARMMFVLLDGKFAKEIQ